MTNCKYFTAKNLDEWYWRLPEDGVRRHKGNYTLEQIRDKYGSQAIAKKELEKIS